MQIENLLQLGLTENEAVIYMMLLRTGPSPASSVAARTGMKRVTAYSVLNSLCERGLVSFEESGQSRRFIPHDPECLLYIVEKEQSEIKFKMQLAKECIGGLQKFAVHSKENMQKIIFHKGNVAVTKFLKERIETQELLQVVFLSFGNGTLLSKNLETFLLNFKNAAESSMSICVPKNKLSLARQKFSNAICGDCEISATINGDLIIQGNKIIFLYSKMDEVELMYLDDALYASFVRDVLLPTCFRK